MYVFLLLLLITYQDDLEAKHIKTETINKLPYGKIKHEGVIFSTYTSLIASQRGGSKSKKLSTRLHQIVNWCGGKDFDGCILLGTSTCKYV